MKSSRLESPGRYIFAGCQLKHFYLVVEPPLWNICSSNSVHLPQEFSGWKCPKKYLKSSTTNVNFAIPRTGVGISFIPFKYQGFGPFHDFLLEHFGRKHHEFTLHGRLRDRMGKFTFSMQKKKRFWMEIPMFQIQRKFQKKNVIFCKQVGRFYCSCKYWVSLHLLEHSFFFPDPRNNNHQQSSDALPFGRFLQVFPWKPPFCKKSIPAAMPFFGGIWCFFLRRSVAESGEFLLAFPFRSAFNNGLMGKLFVKDTNLKCSKNFGKKMLLWTKLGKVDFFADI